MSHIHLPDGVLPVWLWLSGLIAMVFIGTVLFRSIRREEVSKRLPLLGMMAAVMVLGASVEVVPIAYHVNLTVISGILLGPSLIFLATLIVNIILAMFGHGGITVLGLNTLILSLEGILGYYFFQLLWKMFKKLTRSTALSPAFEGGDGKRRSGSNLSKPRHLCRGGEGLTPAVFLATFLSLLVSTSSMIGVVSLGASHYEEMIHQGDRRGIFEFELSKEKRDQHEKEAKKEEVNLKRFMAIILPLGFIGWVLEGVITSLIARYIYRIRPELLRLKGAAP
jgi:cobalt/nickel transport system permease protein